MTNEHIDSAGDEPEEYGPYDHEHPPPLDFERWAALAASLIGVDPEDRIDHLLARRIDPALFDACEAFWATTIASQIQRGELGLAKRFGALCAEVVERGQQAPPPHAAPEGPSDEASPDATAFLISIPDAPVLPFQPNRAAAPPERAEVADEPAPAIGATALISADLLVGIDAALPFATEAPMDPERYAEVVARTEGMPPGVTAAIHAELGVTDRTRLDADMKRFLANDADARARYDALVDRMRKEIR